MLKIGEAARESGLTTRAIRYYEELGLVNTSGKSRGGFRLYSEKDLQDLRNIKLLQAAGFSLKEIKDAFEIRKNSATAAEAIARQRDLIERRRREIDRRLGELEKVKAELNEALWALEACHACHDTPDKDRCKGCDAFSDRVVNPFRLSDIPRETRKTDI